MNRLLSILISLFVLFLVYLWINHIMQAPPRSEFPDETSTRVVEPQSQNPSKETYTPENTHENADDGQSEDSEIIDNQQDDAGTEEGTETTEENKPEQPPATVPESKPKDETPTTSTSPPPSSALTGGVHLVIAGNFLERGNAEKRAAQLREKGYASAEVVRFQLSQYHTVCAGRFDDLRDARSTANRLKNQHSIDAYVRIGN